MVLSSKERLALWGAVTWYAFLHGLELRTEGYEHMKGAYTIQSSAGAPPGPPPPPFPHPFGDDDEEEEKN